MSQNGAAHVPPQNLEAEESVLGAMLVSGRALENVFLETHLGDDDFYRESHRIIFRAIKDLYNRSQPVDALTVAEHLTQHGELDEVGGRDAVNVLAASTPAPGNARHYAEIVRQNALLRRLLAAAQTIQGSIFERDGEPRDLVEQAERLLFQVAHSQQSADFRSVSDILVDEVEKLERLANSDSELTGVASGFRELDSMTGGFQAGNLIILAARPSMGKSTLVANIADNVSSKGQPVAFFSLEMSETELAHRFIACKSGISSDKLRKGQVRKADWPKVLKACNVLEQAPLWIDESSDLGLLDLRAKARRLHAQEKDKGGLGLIIVDYIQLMRADDPRANRVEQVSQMSRGLKILARELDVPVMGLSQLSRGPEQRPDKRPILSDLRDSGAIEQDADVVAFIYRDEVYNEEAEPGAAELIISKHRNGPIGKVDLVFRPEFPKFMNRSRQDASAPPVEAAA